MARKKLTTKQNRSPFAHVKAESTRVLIVCEGKKTEIEYFQKICEKLGLRNVKVRPSTNSASHLVHKTAKDKQTEAIKKNKPYDKIFCVFDDDNQKDFQKISDDIDSDKKNGFEKARSSPCIEFWFSLHFKYTDKNFKDCQECLKDLKKQFPEYDKEITNAIFETLWDKKDTAKKHAKQAKKSSSNTFTEIHFLVEELEKLAE